MIVQVPELGESLAVFCYIHAHTTKSKENITQTTCLCVFLHEFSTVSVKILLSGTSQEPRPEGE